LGFFRGLLPGALLGFASGLFRGLLAGALLGFALGFFRGFLAGTLLGFAPDLFRGLLTGALLGFALGFFRGFLAGALLGIALGLLDCCLLLRLDLGRLSGQSHSQLPGPLVRLVARTRIGLPLRHGFRLLFCLRLRAHLGNSQRQRSGSFRIRVARSALTGEVELCAAPRRHARPWWWPGWWFG